MGQEPRRLLIAPARLQQATAGLLPLTPEERRYLVKVLRFGPGALFLISDGAGGLWEAELLEPERARLRQPLEAPLAWQPPPRPPLVLLAALVKRDYEVLVRMAVELGADWLLPCRGDYDAVAGKPNLERWRTIAREAAEQCERPWLPQLLEPQPACTWLGASDPLASLAAGASGAVSAPGSAAMSPPGSAAMSAPGSAPAPVPEALDGPGSRPAAAQAREAPPGGWDASRSSLRLVASTRQSGAVPLLAALESWTDPEPPGSLWLACGPEGGWSGAEQRLAWERGWIPVDLGPRILRSSTAAVTGLGLLSDWRYRRWGC